MPKAPACNFIPHSKNNADDDTWTCGRSCRLSCKSLLSGFVGSFRAIPEDLASLNRKQTIVVTLFGALMVVFSIVDFNHLINPESSPSVLKWVNDRDLWGRETWQLVLMTLSGISSWTGAVTVVQAARGKWSTWSWGLVNTIFYGAVAFAYGYAGDAQLYYFFFLPTQFIGMASWEKQLEDETKTAITKKPLGILQWAVVLCFCAAVYTFFHFEIPAFSRALVGYYIFEGPNGEVTAPWILDALSNAFNISAQILMIRRHFEQWIFWVSVNCIQIGMFSGIAFPIDFNVVCMFSLFLINSLYGLYIWFRRSVQSSKRHALGICVGKFYPPHKGHEFLVNKGILECDRFVVIVCVKAGEHPNEERADWLQENCPGAKVLVYDEAPEMDPNDSTLWAHVALSILDGKIPAACYCSEVYGDSFAKALGPNVVNVNVDQKRATYPISGTQVRADPFRAWQYLSPNVRQFYSLLVVLVGAESTGKTTLAANLAERFSDYSPVLVSEHGRIVTDRKASPRDNWTEDDFREICSVQSKAIDNGMKRSFLVIADTDAIATVAWQRLLMGHVTPDIEKLAACVRPPSLYLLCPVEGSKFVQDGTRADGDHRVSMEKELHDRCSRKLVEASSRNGFSKNGKLVKLVGDDWKERTDEAVRAMIEMFGGERQ